MDVKSLKEKASILITKISNDFGWVDLDKDNESVILDNITISEDPCTYSVDCHNIFDVLGVYKKNEKENLEGKIILFDKCIRKYSEWFYDRYKDRKTLGLENIDECVEMVYLIVFWHEIGHWVTHWMKDSLGNRWDDSFWKLKPNPNDLLEGLAQLIVYYAIMNESDNEKMKKLKFIFEDLLIGQPDPYHKHIEIMKHRNFSWSKSFKSLEFIRKYFIKIVDVNFAPGNTHYDFFSLIFRVDEEIFKNHKEIITNDIEMQKMYKNIETLYYQSESDTSKELNWSKKNEMLVFLYENYLDVGNKYSYKDEYAKAKKTLDTNKKVKRFGF